ncbi:hypothetical protein Poli38472_010699 [Pythium oligandrum]|uniref:Uncharacterized protein n=1 Tax=Pythium oligandrum TaxID=41045 RepID=A0A8K1FGG9_PYTOL|nr:hypothetical protein Poli38472_010699 [Pythium oligandrum]|eukprot:TMW61636.1 hypothetical protein Poli38472_010699 [Pythium oligandrum]
MTKSVAWATSSALLIASVAGHGFVNSPMAEFNANVMKTNYVETIDANSVFQGKFDDNPAANAATFTAAFKASQYKTLQDLVLDKGAPCGFTNPNASPKEIPQDGTLVWKNPDTGEGFIPSHTGPCEAWIDDKMIFHDDDCATHYAGNPEARIKMDFSSCNGKCTLKFYWLALHEPKWQVYKNCIPMQGAYNAPAPTPSMSPAPAPPSDNQQPGTVTPPGGNNGGNDYDNNNNGQSGKKPCWRKN